MTGSFVTDTRSIVTGLYDALTAGDGAAVAAIVEENFAVDAVLTRPDSLPGGGATEGVGHIARFMKGAAAARPTVRIRGVYETSVGGVTDVFVDLTIDMGGGPVPALEWWTFAEDKVVAIKAFYWDTAALLAGQPN